VYILLPLFTQPTPSWRAGRSEVSCSEPTLHTRTAIVVAEALTGARFAVSQQEGPRWLITCEGAAVKAGRSPYTAQNEGQGHP
jgi:hypothetical protein